MKNLLMIIVAALTLFCSCDKNNVKNDNKAKSYQLEKEVIDNDQVFVPFNIPFPEGTTYEIKGSEMYFTLPDDYYAVGIDADGNYYKSAEGGSGSITCACTEGSGCDPIKQGDEVGCLMKNGCSECSKTISKIKDVSHNLIDLIIIRPVTNLFISKFEQIEGNYFLPSAFIEYPEILELLTEIKSEQDKMESDTEVVFINVFGYIIPLEIKTAPGHTALVGSKITCTCNVSGSCPKESHWSGVVWCNTNNCTNCTMSGVAVNAEMVSKHFSSENGKIELTD